jgi:hypothetical protein
VVVAGAAIHLTFLAANMTAVRLLGIGRARSATASGASAAEAAVGVQRAVILVTSQKTLPVRIHTNDCILRRALDRRGLTTWSWVQTIASLTIGCTEKCSFIAPARRCSLTYSEFPSPQVAVTVLGQLAAAGVAPGAAGLATVPAVIAHLVQIILDSVLASRWQSQDAAAAQKAAWS